MSRSNPVVFRLQRELVGLKRFKGFFSRPGTRGRRPATGIVRSLWAPAILCVLIGLQPGCAPREIRPEGAWLEDREQLFERHPRWSVNGRLGLSDGERGGSLAFDWQADGDHHRVGLRTAAGGRQWRLEFGPGYAVLEGSEVGQMIGTDPDPLVEQAVGWPIPVVWLSRWLRGLPAPDEAVLAYAPDGTLQSLRHDGWMLDFQRYRTGQAEVLLPVRLQAINPPYRVRAALSGWDLGQ